ncbi:prenyltransferase/squalene oxidase repeat-containing protein [Tautonia plasticadhaerens]|nr:prenyltransferase/squalene oxidase repeat-containing protein [Tautonia plasticadhaerens]
MSRRTALGLGVAGLVTLSARPRRALGRQDASPGAMAAKAVAFLRSRQGEDGSWSGDRDEPGITALVLTGLLRSGQVTPFEPVARKGLAYLEQFVSPEGGLPEASHANYATAIAIMAFHEANRDGRYDAVVEGGREFLKAKQWDETEGKGPDDVFYGGAGYGGRSDRPDLSNTTFMVEALRETGLPADDPALQKALVFISRSQNLDGEFNDQPWAGEVDDGGFIYTPANGGSSVAGEATGGGLRSYGSMTYAGFKSLIHAGLTRDDPRVEAALGFIRANYTLEENPGLGQAGLYYYYQAFAKALAAFGEPTITDAGGTERDWRADLTAALAGRQGPRGEWVNPSDRFMEGDPNLVTAYGLLALAAARPRG